MIENRDLTFTGNSLYHGSKDTGYSVVLWSVNGWKVRWPDGVLSADWYNLARARENCRKVYLEGGSRALGGGPDAFKFEIGTRVA